jgi:antitoxin HigA-1
MEAVVGTRAKHPGAALWDVLEPLGLTVGQLADALGVTRKTLSAIINGRQGITPAMSVRLGKALGDEPEAWALRQLAFDMASVDRANLSVRRLPV